MPDNKKPVPSTYGRMSSCNMMKDVLQKFLFDCDMKMVDFHTTKRVKEDEKKIDKFEQIFGEAIKYK